MTASTRREARLRELRLVGFKSFAEATRLEFGPGISAVVGPNGSGKSNLADALRWALGEQGRALRARKSEDVIFAGSARRHATGMADVSLVIDNVDRLLPVEYGLVECGRRLYRSGENEYLLNRQKVRLRDLVDLLDAANLADNAFLFIGQGMVDQALSLRPEERRPLFEEAAGVRRHERRRRQAEERLVEAEANLARVRDILGELRPQARRLQAQAEQQVARRDAATELAEALVAAGRARWTSAWRASTAAAETLVRVRHEIDAALRDLSAAEDGVAALARGLSERAEATRRARAALEAARASVTETRLTIERLTEVRSSQARDEARARAERMAAEERTAAARRVLALPVPGPDLGAQAAVAEIDLAIAEATTEIARAEASLRAEGDREASLRRARQARDAETNDLRRRSAEAERRRDEAEAAGRSAATTAAAAEEDHRAALAALEATRTKEARADATEQAARAAADLAEARAASATGRQSAADERVARLRERLEIVDSLLEATERGGLVRAARRRGGRRLAEGLEVDPDRRLPVEAALGDLLKAVVTDRATALQLRSEQGLLVLDSDHPGTGSGARPDRAAGERLLALVAEAGGGPLVDAIRRDPGGQVTRLLATTAWLPDLGAALALHAQLPPGWRLVTIQGEVVTADGVVHLGAPDPILERRAERDRLVADVAVAEQEAMTASTAANDARAEAQTANVARTEARRLLDEARAERRRIEEVERAAARAVEAASREAAWEAAQVERLTSEAARAADALAASLAAVGTFEAAPDTQPPAIAASDEQAALAAWQARLARLRDRRVVIGGDWEATEATRRRAEDERRRAEVALSLDAARLADLEREATARALAMQRAEDELAAAHSARLVAEEAEAEATRSLAALEAQEGDERQGLIALEADVLRYREHLRRADDGARTAEVAELEARLALDAARETLLVELAALGMAGLAALALEDGPVPSDEEAELGARPPEPIPPGAVTGGREDGERAEDDDETLAASLEAALDLAVASWRQASAEATPPEAPSPARLGLLRRRYHELGASNPYASDEYAEVRDRLAAMEAQQADLTVAMEATRALIAELSTRITEQFLATFAALEGAFARRFEQLFGGGAASLELTDPAELSQTGVEIMARPPGKKRQPLAMLSGGERALTAVALLFAMLEVRPVPFCVLDEVDAALDEANVTRFAAALRELAETIQFVVITHNRGTIEAADALYGVTIGDDAVSRIISLRLAEATELVGTAES